MSQKQVGISKKEFVIHPYDRRIAILSNEIEDIGKSKKVQRRMDLNTDRKRLWFEDLKSINDGKMVDSLQLSFNFFNKKEI